jgi:hypothetical protein
VSEYQTLASLGIKMHVVGYNAKLLRDQAGNNTDYYTNSITLGGGESLDATLDTCLVRSNPADLSSGLHDDGGPGRLLSLHPPDRQWDRGCLRADS